MHCVSSLPSRVPSWGRAAGLGIPSRSPPSPLPGAGRPPDDAQQPWPGKVAGTRAPWLPPQPRGQPRNSRCNYCPGDLATHLFPPTPPHPPSPTPGLPSPVRGEPRSSRRGHFPSPPPSKKKKNTTAKPPQNQTPSSALGHGPSLPGPLLQLNTPLPNFLLVPQGHPIPWATQRAAPQKAAGASQGGGGGKCLSPVLERLGWLWGVPSAPPLGKRCRVVGSPPPLARAGRGGTCLQMCMSRQLQFSTSSSLTGGVHSVPGVLGRGNAFVVIFDISISGDIGTEGGTPQCLHRWLRFASAFCSTGHRNGQVLYSYCHGY